MKTVNFSLKDIKFVLLDMDGTLLDKYFDDFFWEHLVPEKYAEKHNYYLRKSQGRTHEKIQDARGHAKLDRPRLLV